MKVCHVCLSHPADDSRVFSRECVSLAAAGYEVHLIARSGETKEYCDQGVIVHPWPAFPSRAKRFLAALQVAREARTIDADLYHVHEPELLAPTLAAVGNRPVIWDAHEPYRDKIFERPWIPERLKPTVSAGWSMAEWLLLRRCAAVVTVSDLMAKLFEHMHRRVCVLHNYSRLNIMAAGKIPGRRRNRCVFAGTLSRPNNVLGLIRAIAILKKRGLLIGLDLAGKYESQIFMDEINQEVRALDIADRVIFHGLLSRKDAVQLQMQSGIGLVIEEANAGANVGYPIKMFELMALGIPLVYSDLPTFRTVAGESQCGLPVDPDNCEQIADAIAVIANDEKFASQLGAAGRTAIQEKFNWELEESKLLNLYRELIGGPHLRGPQN
jgi:glycosyltransferase involved in cell wall biosynthesis